MILQRLIIENFQSHERTTIDLSPGFNAIVGASNMGKTALTRALSFILSGTWDASWVRQGARSCRISLLTTDGIEIIREKGEKINLYLLRVPGQPERRYENFGVEVPSDIREILRVARAQVDTSDFLSLNLADQLDPLFLLSKPGSFKAKVFGKLSGAHYLDHALRELNREKKTLSMEKTTRQRDLELIEGGMARFSSVEQEMILLRRVENLLDAVRMETSRLKRLQDLLGRVRFWEQQYVSQDEKKRLLDKRQLPTLDEMGASELRLRALRSLAVRITEVTERSASIQADLIKLETRYPLVKDQYVAMVSMDGRCPICLQTLDAVNTDRIKDTL